MYESNEDFKMTDEELVVLYAERRYLMPLSIFY